MDLEKVVELTTRYIGDWSRITSLTLVRPVSRFELSAAGSEASMLKIGLAHTERDLWLHPKLIAFSVISIVIGLSLNTLLPGFVPKKDELVSVLFIFIYWWASASALYVICRLFKGRGTYTETLSVALQVSSSLYVVTSFLTLIASAVFAAGLDKVLGDSIVPGVGGAVTLFFIVSTIVTVVYIPLAMRSVHRFGPIRSVFIGLVVLAGAWLPVFIYKAFGILTTPGAGGIRPS